ncbi:MAG: NAD(P)H-dependent oxidoreductase [Patescibacteria group bacterium]|nr:NAD(P)H-dependent oxidoreductase [Patescibacteria group bacterium]
MKLNIPVILGSVRDSRKSIFPARLINKILLDSGHESVLVDFKELTLPFMFCDPPPASLNKKYPDANVQKWSTIAEAADAFVIVTPEYNHGYPAVLKNALDWLYKEFEYKAVGFAGVSSGITGGARAMEQLRPLMANFSMFAIRETVMFGPVQKAFNAEGLLIDESYNKKIGGFIASLVFAAEGMKKLREGRKERQ